MSTSILLAFLIPALGVDTHQLARHASCSWPQVEQQIQWHREHVRWCGPLSAIRALRLLGHDLDAGNTLEPLRDGDPRGMPIEDVLALCRDYEPHARFVRLRKRHWRWIPTPCILIVNDNRHALVLEALSPWRKTARVWDPSVMQVQTISLAQLRDIWNGDAILLQRPPWLLVGLAILNIMIAILLWIQRRQQIQFKSSDRRAP